MGGWGIIDTVNAIFDPDELMTRRLPGANLDVGLRFLGGDPEGPYWMAVVFPPGFHRPGGPAVDVTEGYFVLRGELRYSGVVSPAHSYTVIPPGSPRVDTRTEVPTVAVARFATQPRWSDVGDPDAPPPVVTTAEGPPAATPLGPGWTLGAHDGMTVVLVPETTSEAVAADCFLLSLTDGSTTVVAAGENPPPMPGPIGAWIAT